MKLFITLFLPFAIIAFIGYLYYSVIHNDAYKAKSDGVSVVCMIQNNQEVDMKKLHGYSNINDNFFYWGYRAVPAVIKKGQKEKELSNVYLAVVPKRYKRSLAGVNLKGYLYENVIYTDITITQVNRIRVMLMICSLLSFLCVCLSYGYGKRKLRKLKNCDWEKVVSTITKLPTPTSYVIRCTFIYNSKKYKGDIIWFKRNWHELKISVGDNLMIFVNKQNPKDIISPELL